ncbi:uncharacterized protein TNCV_412511 [Trichonephila clavipes]|uniref:Uncharacterized protein n=1 Tax=Trichonephila clavipes TaxID=2585209 RepID=A0A8X6SDK2_TRICX|nr:uncharacterized protein TNCV_412511 [Trichonephila clavipes]
MVSDGTEFTEGDIERRSRDVQIKVNDWVLVATHPLSSATRKVVAKFKPKFEGPYRVLDVKNNNELVARITVVFESSGFDRVQRRSNDSRDGKKKGSEVKRELEEKGLSFRNDQGEKHTNKTKKSGPLIRSIPSSWSEKGRMNKKSKNERLGYKRSKKSSALPRLRKKNRWEETVTPTTSGYNLRPRNGKREESRLTIERKTQQGGPVPSRKGRERDDSPYIE